MHTDQTNLPTADELYLGGYLYGGGDFEKTPAGASYRKYVVFRYKDHTYVIENSPVFTAKLEWEIREVIKRLF